CCQGGGARRELHSFPTRRSSDLSDPKLWQTDRSTFEQLRYTNLYTGIDALYGGNGRLLKSEFEIAPGADVSLIRIRYEGIKSVEDRKSTRLNSSHVEISYAVFCL